MEILCCTQTCVYNMQIHHFITPREFLKMPLLEWYNHMCTYFVVVETRGDLRAPIILGRPFLCTAKAIIYADSAKICFTINDKKEKSSFKNRIHHSPGHP